MTTHFLALAYARGRYLLSTSPCRLHSGHTDSDGRPRSTGPAARNFIRDDASDAELTSDDVQVRRIPTGGDKPDGSAVLLPTVPCAVCV